MGGLVPVGNLIAGQRDKVAPRHKITDKGRHERRKQPDQCPHNADTKRRQRVVKNQHQQKLREKQHDIDSQRANARVHKRPGGERLGVALHPPQQDGYGHFQRDHQQDLARAQQRLARKQTAAALQRIQQLGSIALDLHVPQAAGDQCHHNGH